MSECRSELVTARNLHEILSVPKTGCIGQAGADDRTAAGPAGSAAGADPLALGAAMSAGSHHLRTLVHAWLVGAVRRPQAPAARASATEDRRNCLPLGIRRAGRSGTNRPAWSGRRDEDEDRKVGPDYFGTVQQRASLDAPQRGPSSEATEAIKRVHRQGAKPLFSRR